MYVNKPKEYINQKFTFLNKIFYIDQGAHIPRPSTEYIATSYINSINSLKINNLTIADIGTGTGVLAISIGLQCPCVHKIYATDLFNEALHVAEINVSKFKLKRKIFVLQGNLFEPILQKKVDIIVANLPFASDEKMKVLRPEVLKYEPLTGIHGGSTGFELYTQLFEQLSNYKYFNSLKGLWIYCNIEHLPQVNDISNNLFNGFKLQVIWDKYKPYYRHCYFYRD